MTTSTDFQPTLSDGTPCALAEGWVIPIICQGTRLDQALAQAWTNVSRTQIQKALQDEQIWVNGAPCPQRYRVKGGEIITGRLPEREPVAWSSRAQTPDTPFSILHEDEHVLIVVKGANLVVHPAPGHTGDTLVNYLLHSHPNLAHLPRAGLIHRLDKDTTGLLVVAKTAMAHQDLNQQLARRAFKREYWALVHGVPISGGTIDEPIGRDTRNRERMRIQPETGREAVTHYRIMAKFREHALLRLQLETGRTHQIRVHLKHLGFPIIGDPVYGGRCRLPTKPSPALKASLSGFHRQALHAHQLGFVHPQTQAWVEWETPVPEDFQALQDALSEDAHSPV